MGALEEYQKLKDNKAKFERELFTAEGEVKTQEARIQELMVQAGITVSMTVEELDVLIEQNEGELHRITEGYSNLVMKANQLIAETEEKTRQVSAGTMSVDLDI